MNLGKLYRANKEIRIANPFYSSRTPMGKVLLLPHKWMEKGIEVSNQQEPPQYLSKNPFHLGVTLVHNPVCYEDEFYCSSYGHDEFPQRQSQ